MQKTVDDKRIIGKIHPFGGGIFEDKNLFVFRKYRFFKVIKPRECIDNYVIFARDKVNARVVLLNIIELANFWSGVVLLVIMLRWSVWIYNTTPRSMVHNNGEEFFTTNSIFQLGITEFA